MKSKLYNRIALIFAALLMLTFSITAQTTINIKVSEADDDVEEFVGVYETNPDGFMDIGSSDLELCTQNENNQQAVGVIFRNVQIPVGATVTNAYVQFTCDDNDNVEGPLSIDIHGFKEANTSAPFTADLFGVTSRPATTATVNWQCPVWEVVDERGPLEATPDIKSIIQEIIGISGWASGNNLGVKFTNSETLKIHREAEAFEDNNGTGAAELFVTFTTGTQVNEIGEKVTNLVYPNPAEGRIIISNSSSERFGYAIYNITGQLVTSRTNLKGSTIEVDLSNLARGTYFVNVTNADKTETQKLILK